VRQFRFFADSAPQMLVLDFGPKWRHQLRVRIGIALREKKRSCRRGARARANSKTPVPRTLRWRERSCFSPSHLSQLSSAHSRCALYLDFPGLLLAIECGLARHPKRQRRGRKARVGLFRPRPLCVAASQLTRLCTPAADFNLAKMSERAVVVPDRMLNGDVSLLVIPPCALDLTPFPCDNSAPTSPSWSLINTCSTSGTNTDWFTGRQLEACTRRSVSLSRADLTHADLG
jgi:hypothetical protein